MNIELYDTHIIKNLIVKNISHKFYYFCLEHNLSECVFDKFDIESNTVFYKSKYNTDEVRVIKIKYQAVDFFNFCKTELSAYLLYIDENYSTIISTDENKDLILNKVPLDIVEKYYPDIII